MSQIVRIRIQKTVIKEKDLLIQAIKDAGYTSEQSGFFVAENEVRIRGRQVWFKKTGDFYEMVSRGDRTAPQILQEITQHYIYRVTCKKLEEQGFAVTSEEKQKDGRIHLVLRRMA